MRNFFLRTNKNTGTAPLYTRIRKKSPKVDIFVNTHIKVTVNTWLNAERGYKVDKNGEQTSYTFANYFKSKEGTAVQSLLLKVDDAITSLKSYDKSLIDEEIRAVVFPEQIKKEKEREEREREEREREEAERARLEEEERKNVITYLDKFVADMANGKKKNGQNKYGYSTVKTWKGFVTCLKRFYSQHPFTWDDIDEQLVSDYANFMEGMGFMPTTINKRISHLRALSNRAMRDRKHHNTLADGSFSKISVKDEDKARELYLTSEEVQALYEMNLSGKREIIRDVFLIGCYTCQRFSDYSRIEEENILTTEKGYKVIQLTQKKTGKEVFVPFLNDNLEKLLRKYNYNVPTDKLDNVVMNREIKLILQELAKSVPSLAKEERTVLTLSERTKEERGEVRYKRDEKGHVVKPRYEMVCSHTARRTGITLLYKSGLFDIVQLMHVSGHRDTKTFLSYIKLSSKEIAEEIAKRAEEAKKRNINPF